MVVPVKSLHLKKHNFKEKISYVLNQRNQLKILRITYDQAQNHALWTLAHPSNFAKI